jgi:eukaryotic-like serine/threonine-protein kinase
VADAVRHAGEFGIAEYLAAAPQLLAERRDAWAPAMHPRAAAMVLAAVDARRAGVHRPLPPRVLLRMHEPYLRARGGERLRPEPAQTALEWATTPLYATSSLLLPAGDGFLAFDYLIDGADKDRVPPQALDALISFSTPQESLDIGELAWRWSLTGQAEAGFRHAEAGGLFKATARRCHLIREDLGGHAAALRFAKDAAAWTSAVHGPDHTQTLDALKLVAWETGHSGDPDAARHQLEYLADRASRFPGAGHKQTLEMRFGVAEMTGLAGDRDRAVHLYEELAEDCRRRLGDDDGMTIQCRDQVAWWVREAGDPRRAARLFRELIADMTGRLGSPADEVFGTRYRLAACLTEAGDYETALHDWERLITEATAANGRLWNDALVARREHAECAGRAGDPAQAVRLLQALLADTEALNEPGSVLLLHIRRSLAEWTGKAGNPAQAIRQLRALINEAAQQRGDNDPRVRNLDRKLIHWTTVTDASPKAIPSPETARGEIS